MKNHYLDITAYSVLYMSKLEKYMQTSRNRLLESNPDFKFEKKLTETQDKMVKLYQMGSITKEDIPIDDLNQIEEYFKESQEASLKLQSGELKTDFFTPEEIKELIFITPEEFETCIIDGKKE